MSTETLTIDPKPENGLAEIGNKISTGLAAFEIKKSELEELKKGVEGLDITSIDDKTSIKTVSEARKRLKSARIEIEKDAKSMRDGLTERSRFISQKEKELIDIIGPTEDALKEKEDWVKSENRRIADEKEQKKKERLQDRIDRLAEYGFEIDLVMLEGIDDEQFEKVLVTAKKQFDIEQADKKEKDRITEEERQELEDLRKQKAEMGELRKKEQERRQDQLYQLGLRVNFGDNHYKGYETFVPFLDIQTKTVSEWSELMGKLTTHIQSIKERDAAEADEQKKKAEADEQRWRGRLSVLDNVGWNGVEAFARYDETVVVATIGQLITLSNDEFDKIKEAHNNENNLRIEERRKADEKKAQEIEEQRLVDIRASERTGMLKVIGNTYPGKDLGKLSEEDWGKFYADAKVGYDKKQKEISDEKAEEASRQEAERVAQASDKDKFEEVIKQISAISIPDMKSAKHKKLSIDTKALLSKVIDHIKSKA